MKLIEVFFYITIFVGVVQAEEQKFQWDDYFDIVTIPNPSQVDTQIGGLDMTADGKLIACFHRGEVMTFDPETEKWSQFAYGLHEPLGILVENEGTVLVIQRGELTRLHDEDKDGKADFYEAISTDWGLSGNYHEFTFGLVKDSKGSAYIALGTASNGSGVREEVRGPWNDTGGLTQQKFLYGGDHGDWKEKKQHVPRMYARVPYRGCVLKIPAGSSKAEVYATGLRTPNGLYMDSNDCLWITDNQGDWVGASKLFRIEQGKFHGHAASLLWSKNPPDIIPANIPIPELDKMRVRSAVLLPQGDCGNSVTQMLPGKESFGDLASNSKLVGEMNHSRLVQYLPDTVKGQLQGTATHYFNTDSLGMGNNRMVYSPDGKSLYIGKTHLSWPGRKGLKKITFKGKNFLQVTGVQLTDQGFKFTFSEAIEGETDPKAFKTESYGIDYHAAYGSKKVALAQETYESVVIDKNTLTLKLVDPPKANRVYDITLPFSIRSADSLLSANRFWYTAHRVW